MKLIGYVRISKDDSSSHSIAGQRKLLKQWCELRGYELVAVVRDEGVSAGVPFERRPGGAEVLNRLRRREANGVVGKCVDRLWRDTYNGLGTVAWLDRRGLVLNLVQELVDTSTAAGRYMLTLLLGSAQYERDRVCERNRDTYEYLKGEGRKYGGVPFGLTAVGGEEYTDPDTGATRTKGARLFKDPDTWPLREQVVREYSHAGSLRKLALRLKKQGIPAPNGGTFWSLDTLSRLVKTHHELQHIPMLDDGLPRCAGGPA